jgi:serine/threonine protein phosphatase 1
VGDVHGMFRLLLQAMRAASFDTTRDRLFLVGDLIDRGAGSHHALRFLRLPFVHSVRGNHDDDFMWMSLREIRDRALRSHEMLWTNGVSDARMVALQEEFARLPTVIELETARGTVGIVHAEVPVGMDWNRFKLDLERGDAWVFQAAVAGRERIQRGVFTGVPGVDRVYCGHTIQLRGPLCLGNVFYLDTGAVVTGARRPIQGSITLVNVDCAKSEVEQVVNPVKMTVIGQPGSGNFEDESDAIPMLFAIPDAKPTQAASLA